MKNIDYENMFIYMSLVFAFCIFIILLYGCAFASVSRGVGDSQIYENFLNEDDKGDIKSQVVSLLTELESKDTTSAEDKKKLSDALEKINNNNISISELKTVIDLLKEMMPKTVSKKSSAATAATAATAAKAPSTTATAADAATAATAADASAKAPSTTSAANGSSTGSTSAANGSSTDTTKAPTAPSSATTTDAPSPPLSS